MYVKRRRGVGMYSDSVCFDPARPAWLPYWLDDFQETACKANMLWCGNTTCGNTNAIAEQKASGATVITPSGGKAITDPNGNPLLDVYNSTPSDPSGSMLPWVIGGIAALLAVGFVAGKR